MEGREKITIIEGPTPTFELVSDPWLLGLAEGMLPSQIAFCQVRTFNGPDLLERCYRAWREGQPVELEYRGEDGLPQQAQIVAARWTEVEEGHLLLLWVRLDEGEIEVEFDFDLDDFDDSDDEFDEGDPALGL